MHRAVLILALSSVSVAASAQRVDWANSQELAITLTNFEFAPEPVMLTHGQVYRLHLVNQASGGHNFVARDFFARATIAPQDRAKVDNGAVELDAGQSVDIRLMAPAAGEYDLHCSHFMHSVFGMTGTIVVR